jgi:hypothetical protein
VQVEHRPRPKRARPLRVGVAEHQVDPVRGGQVTLERPPARIRVGPEAPRGRRALLDEPEPGEGGAVVGALVGDEHGGGESIKWGQGEEGEYDPPATDG